MNFMAVVLGCQGGSITTTNDAAAIDSAIEENHVAPSARNRSSCRFRTRQIGNCARFAQGRALRLGQTASGAGTPSANHRFIMTSTEGKAGFGIAWLLGIPLPILLIVYLVSRC